MSYPTFQMGFIYWGLKKEERESTIRVMSNDASFPEVQEIKSDPATKSKAVVVAVLNEVNRVAKLKFPQEVGSKPIIEEDDPDLAVWFVDGVFDGKELGKYIDPKTGEVQELKGESWTRVAGREVEDHKTVFEAFKTNREALAAGGNISDALHLYDPDKHLFPGIDWFGASLKTPEGQTPVDISPKIIAFLEKTMVERKDYEKELIKAFWGSPLPEAAVKMAEKLGMSSELQEIAKTPSGLDETAYPKRVKALKELFKEEKTSGL